ncbi:hypothetical protein R69746_03154 [Paraburkholderia aspalathi]|nr:hypothetical protein R69746_03154 [Paraburkholderia aspalathi]
MTTDVSAHPPAQPPGALPPGEPGQQPPSDAPPPRRRRGRLLLKTLAWMVAVLVLLVAVAIGLLYGALTTERGTAYAWQAAVKLRTYAKRIGTDGFLSSRRRKSSSISCLTW